MLNNVESILSYFSQIRRSYADNLVLKYKGYKLSPNEISVLIVLVNNKNINTARQLQALLSVSKGLVSRSTDSLMSLGLIKGVKDNKDKRVIHLYLTDESDEFIKDMLRQINDMNNMILQEIPKEELVQMENTMKKILDRFKSMEERDNENKEK